MRVRVRVRARVRVRENNTPHHTAPHRAAPRPCQTDLHGAEPVVGVDRLHLIVLEVILLRRNLLYVGEHLVQLVEPDLTADTSGSTAVLGVHRRHAGEKVGALVVVFLALGLVVGGRW